MQGLRSTQKMPAGRFSLFPKHEPGAQLWASREPHEARNTPVVFHLVFSIASHFPDELLGRILVDIFNNIYLICSEIHIQ